MLLKSDELNRLQGDNLAQAIIAAARTLLTRTTSTSSLQMALRLLPSWLKPHIATAMCTLGAGAGAENARNVLYSVSDSLAQNYCAAHEDIPPWRTPPGLTQPHGCRIAIATSVVPSEDSVLASLTRSRYKCANPCTCSVCKQNSDECHLLLRTSHCYGGVIRLAVQKAADNVSRAWMVYAGIQSCQLMQAR
jgi:hypothetical protein